MKDEKLDVVDDEDVVSFTDAPSTDESRSLADMGRELYALDSEKDRIEKRLKEIGERRQTLTMRELPEYMTKIGQDRLGLSEFNVDVVMEDYYHANIKAEWPEEQRQAAFDWLEENGHGDIVKCEVAYAFPKSMLETARKLVRLVSEMELKNVPEPVVGLMVPWNTLTAFVKEQVRKGARLPLDTLGATVGKVVKIKPRK